MQDFPAGVHGTLGRESAIRQARTLMESKQHMTRPFCTSTLGGGCAKRHSSSLREHLFRVNSRQTSRVSHRESFTPAAPPPSPGVPMAAAAAALVAAGGAATTIAAGLSIGLTTAIVDDRPLLRACWVVATARCGGLWSYLQFNEITAPSYSHTITRICL